MAPMIKKEHVIVNLFYVQDEDSNYLRSINNWHTQAGAAVPHEIEWVERIMMVENANVPSYIKPQYCEWRFLTGDRSIFVVGPVCYDRASLVIGEEATYWAFSVGYMPQYRIEGSALLPVKCCPCCLSNHYMPIIKGVLDYVKKHRD